MCFNIGALCFRETSIITQHKYRFSPKCYLSVRVCAKCVIVLVSNRFDEYYSYHKVVLCCVVWFVEWLPKKQSQSLNCSSKCKQLSDKNRLILFLLIHSITICNY